MNIYNLRPIYENKKSYYGKAKIAEQNDKKILFSYNTPVAEIELYLSDNRTLHKIPIIFGLHSRTTTRHIKEFLAQEGFKSFTTKDLKTFMV